MPARREQIYDLLKKKEWTAQELANYFQIELKWILDDLNHLAKSIKPKKVKIKPAYCKSCGFVFKERSRLKSPSKCPRCKKEWIQAALLRVED